MPDTRLLLIEDIPSDARWLQDAIELEPEGETVRVAWAKKLQTGLARLAEGGFAGVLLNLDLPDSQGLETLRQVQACLPTCPIVVLSTTLDDEVAAQAMQSGAQDYLVKGQVNGRDILRAVRHAIERKRFELDLQQRAREMQALYETSLEINAQVNLDALLQALVERAARLVGAPMAGLYLLQPDGQTLRLDYVYNTPQEYRGATLKVGEGASGRVLQSGQALVVDDYTHWEGRSSSFEDPLFRRIMAVPLKIGGQVIGVINMNDNRPGDRPWGEDEVRLATLFADQAAIALHNARLLAAERQRSAELARSNAVVAALSQVASRMGETLDPEEILEILGSELARLGFAVQVSLFTGDPPSPVLSYVSLRPQVIESIENLLQRKLVGLPIPGLIWPGEFMGSERKAVFMLDPLPFLAKAMPATPATTFAILGELAGIDSHTGMVHLLLRIKEHLIGLMSVWGQDLREADVPAFFVFANQVAATIENARLYSRIERQATTDELTGLHNRRGFFLLAEQLLRVAQRTMTELLLIFIDVDQLKQINDTLGHKEGDHALVDTAEALNATFRSADIKARISGDEFAVLAFPTLEAAALPLMERLKQEVDLVNARHRHPFKLSLSAGYAVWAPGQSLSLDELLARADAQMYQVKRKKTGELKL